MEGRATELRYLQYLGISLPCEVFLPSVPLDAIIRRGHLISFRVSRARIGRRSARGR